MGYMQIDNDLYDRLDPNEILVYLALKRHMPNAFPGYERLAEVSKLSRSTVARALKSLRDKGLVVWRRTGRTNIYLLTESLKTRTGAREPVTVSSAKSHTDTSEVSQGDIRSVSVRLKEEQEKKNKRRSSVKPRPAAPVTQEEERMDWDKPAMGTDSPDPVGEKRTGRRSKAMAEVVSKDSLEYCSSVFQTRMIGLNIRMWNRKHLRKLLSTLHQDHTWEEIALLIEEFADAKGDEIRFKSKAHDPVALFQQSLNTGFERMVLPKQRESAPELDLAVPGDRIIARADAIMAEARNRRMARLEKEAGSRG